MGAGDVGLAEVDWCEEKWATVEALYLRALDSRSENSILNDHAAAEAFERVDYDLARHGGPKGGITPFMLAVRAKQVDSWTADFLARHPDATVLYLGCGLDSRAFRLGLPADVRWIDLDLPDIIELRGKLYPRHDQHQMIGASAFDPAWLGKIPADRPVLIIAEGLLMYFPEDDVRALFQRLTSRFETGELIFDGVAPWVTRLSAAMHWPVRDPRDIEQMDSRISLLSEVSLVAHHAIIPVRRYRALFRLMHAIPVTRNMARQFRFGF
ncbi:MAG: tetracenomycin polyketide synthesis O-methyltransferase tcmP [Actinomycetia bacterium]|nr:tetracenomycin polyketide synthesis O-methyltransferase tcmP [Actinomycetes bacterium]